MILIAFGSLGRHWALRVPFYASPKEMQIESAVIHLGKMLIKAVAD
jgi:hypothetical protein